MQKLGFTLQSRSAVSRCSLTPAVSFQGTPPNGAVRHRFGGGAPAPIPVKRWQGGCRSSTFMWQMEHHWQTVELRQTVPVTLPPCRSFCTVSVAKVGRQQPTRSLKGEGHGLSSQAWGLSGERVSSECRTAHHCVICNSKVFYQTGVEIIDAHGSWLFHYWPLSRALKVLRVQVCQ